MPPPPKDLPHDVASRNLVGADRRYTNASDNSFWPILSPAMRTRNTDAAAANSRAGKAVLDGAPWSAGHSHYNLWNTRGCEDRIVIPSFLFDPKAEDV